MACASDAQGFSQHRGGTAADRHVLLRRESIQATDIALGPVQAHVTVHLLNGSKGSLDSLSHLPRQGVERLTFNRRTHDGQRPQKAGVALRGPAQAAPGSRSPAVPEAPTARKRRLDKTDCGSRLRGLVTCKPLLMDTVIVKLTIVFKI